MPLGVMYLYHEIVRPVLEEWGAPKGTLNIISGEGRAIVKSWIADPQVDSLLFFGDSKTGLRIARDCAERGKKAVLELSGNDGLVIWRDADVGRAAEALLECFYGSSQICMVPKYAIVHPDLADPFIERFVSRVRQLRPGYPSDRATVLTPVFKVGLFLEMLAEASNQGAEVLCGGRRVDVEGMPSYKGLFVEPTVVQVKGFELADQLACVREETFFPLLPIIVPDRDSEDRLLDRTLEFLNANRYGLRNSLWTGDQAVSARFVAEVRNGGLLKVNDSHIGFVPYVATHGGGGDTGGPYGEMNHPSLRLSRLQGIVVGN
jgi:acyl-CoA reductase-like NAD-dependent aldehyde dehydrogenase